MWKREGKRETLYIVANGDCASNEIKLAIYRFEVEKLETIFSNSYNLPNTNEAMVNNMQLTVGCFRFISSNGNEAVKLILRFHPTLIEWRCYLLPIH